jgi:hypothetical protein
MSSILALSVSDKIDQYGAYAGFASVLGLAVLSLLYFAQAREVKRLREWAGRAPERAADLQDRATAAAQQRVIAQPQRPGQPGVPQTQPARPGVPGAPGAVPAAATPAGRAAGAAAPAAAAATAAGAATATPPGQQTSVQPAANGAAQSPPGARPGEPLRAPVTATPGGTPPGSTRTNYGPDDRDDDEGRSRLAVGGAIAAVVVVLIVIVVLVTGVLGGGSDDKGTQTTRTLGSSATAPARRTRTTAGRTTQPSATPKPGTYEVSVLNGTTVPGLARGVANRLQNTRFRIGTVTNAATQDRSATLVEFAPGHRAEADAVAKAIDVSSDSIQPLSAGSRTIAGSSATVVVTVGSDQNQTPAAPTGTTTTQ